MLVQLVEAKILGGGVFRARDDIPTEAPTGQVVDRRRQPRQQERRCK